MKRISGFTLMELMLVMFIILLLSGAVTATLSVSFERARRTKAMAEMAEIANACKMYYKDTGAWPYHLRQLFYSYSFGYNQYGEGWQYFDQSLWKGPYLMTFKDYNEMFDPWRKVYAIWPLWQEAPHETIYVVSPGSDTDVEKQLKVLIHRFREK